MDSHFVVRVCTMGSMSDGTTEQRTYRMRKRLDDVEETRRRITEAAVQLHGTVGPKHTTFSAVADLAGVQRSTVYRHFPTEDALFGACTSHWLARHPWPSTEPWAALADPRIRLHRALDDLYGYYEANSDMLANSYRDIAVMPSFVGELMKAQIASMHDVLFDGFSAEERSADLAAAISTAIDFRMWSALNGADLDPTSAAALVTRMVCGVLGGPVPRERL